MESFQFDEQTLTKYGFKRIADESLIIYPLHHSPQQQWEYKETILSLGTVNENIDPLIFNKETPQFSLKFKGERQLEEILWHIDQGKTIVDLLLAIQEQRTKDVERVEAQQKNKPYLEDFRYNDIGGSFFKLKCVPDQKIFRPYEKHATSAFHYTLNDIVILENAKDTLQTGTQSHPAVSFWFLTLESYINTLIKLCCLKKNENFDVLKKQDLHSRMNSLVKLLELDIKLVNQNKIITKINEFARFRNELFHDRHFGEEITFKHTQFLESPFSVVRWMYFKAY